MARERPIPASAARSRAGPRAGRPARHRARPRRRRGRDRDDRDDRPHLGVAIASFVNTFNPEVVVIGGGVMGAGELLLVPSGPKCRAGAAALARPGRDRRRRVRRRGRDDRCRRARVRRIAPAGGGGGMSAGRLVVCPTPIGNLEDVTLRVLAALRDADIVACEDTRRSRVLLDRYGVGGSSSATTSTTSALGRRAGLEDARRARWSLWSPTPARRSCRTRLRARAGMRRRRAGGRGAARARRPRWRRSSPARYPPTGGGSPGSCRARRASWRRCSALPRRWSRSSRQSGVAASLQVLAELDPERPVAVCRELTKLHEEIVRGTAAELAARYASEPPRGEVALVVGGAPSASTRSAPALEALRRLVEAGAKPRPAASVVSELTGVAANGLYRALTVMNSGPRCAAERRPRKSLVLRRCPSTSPPRSIT